MAVMRFWVAVAVVLGAGIQTVLSAWQALRLPW